MSLLADTGDLVTDSGWYHHSSGWGWLMMIGFWPIIMVAGVILARGATDSRSSGGPAPPAQAILAERFARVEIDEIEFRSRLVVLDQR